MVSYTRSPEALIETLTTAFNERDRDRFDPCYADEITVHSNSGTRTMNHDEHWEEVEGIYESFPELTVSLDGVLAADDRVFVRCTYAGTYAGDEDVAESAGRSVEWRHWSEYRLEEGRLAEAWQLSDGLHRNLELGLIEEV